MIITTLSHAELLPTLRSVVKGQVEALSGVADVNIRIRAALERISISRVFDFDGLLEALDELDVPAETVHLQMQSETPVQEPDHALSKPQSSPAKHQSDPEIGDSEDEDDPFSPDPPANPAQPSSPAESPNLEHPQKHPLGAAQPRDQYRTPDVVLITNMPTLITSLYVARDRKHAHRMLRHLSSRLRYLTRSPAHGGPLFVLLNSTTSKPRAGPAQPPAGGEQHQQPPSPSAPSTPSSLSSSPSPSSPSRPPSDQHRPAARQRTREEQSDAAPRSVFNAPAPDPGSSSGEVDEYGYARHPRGHAAASALLARLAARNRPSFGPRFGAVVDLHLLASRVPRTDKDAEGYFEWLGRGDGEDGDRMGVGTGVEMVWVVEVLGDAVGVWVDDPEEGEESGLDQGEKGGGRPDERTGRRFNREQRWAGVEVWEGAGGTRIVDARGFEGVGVHTG